MMVSKYTSAACQQRSYSNDVLFQLHSACKGIPARLVICTWIHTRTSNVYMHAQAEMFKAGFMLVVDLTHMRIRQLPTTPAL